MDARAIIPVLLLLSASRAAAAEPEPVFAAWRAEEDGAPRTRLLVHQPGTRTITVWAAFPPEQAENDAPVVVRPRDLVALRLRSGETALLDAPGRAVNVLLLTRRLTRPLDLHEVWHGEGPRGVLFCHVPDRAPPVVAELGEAVELRVATAGAPPHAGDPAWCAYLRLPRRLAEGAAVELLEVEGDARALGPDEGQALAARFLEPARGRPARLLAELAARHTLLLDGATAVRVRLDTAAVAAPVALALRPDGRVVHENGFGGDDLRLAPTPRVVLLPRGGRAALRVERLD